MTSLSSVQVFGDTPTPADSVNILDILSDPIPEKHYKDTEVHKHTPTQTHIHTYTLFIVLALQSNVHRDINSKRT